MLKNLLILLLLPLSSIAQPEVGLKLGLTPIYAGASLHGSYNWKNKQLSVFAEAVSSGYAAEHLATGILINFKQRERKVGLYGGVGAGYAVGRSYNPGTTTIVSPSNSSPRKESLPASNQRGLLLRSQVGVNFKMGRHMLFNIETGLHCVVSRTSYPVLPLTLGLSYCFNKAKPKQQSKL